MFSLSGNYIDLVVILVLLFFVSGAWRHGFFLILADFASFLLSLLVSFRIYRFVGEFLKSNFNLTKSLGDALGFLITAVLLEAALGKFFSFVVSKLPKKLRTSKINKLMGVVPALGEGIVFVAFLLMLVLGLPIKPGVKEDINSSKIGAYLISKASGVERSINQVFGGVINDSLTYVTVRTGSRDRIDLDTKVAVLTIDEAAESQMLALVNDERAKKGINALTWAPQVVPVSRAHAKDMWERRYFSHYSPEGADVGDRLEAMGVNYSLAGENLALAPTVQTAHTGLMNSEGHRDNILDPRFKKIGIGVIDNGVYGKMFVQVFTD